LPLCGACCVPVASNVKPWKTTSPFRPSLKNKCGALARNLISQWVTSTKTAPATPFYAPLLTTRTMTFRVFLSLTDRTHGRAACVTRVFGNSRWKKLGRFVVRGQLSQSFERKYLANGGGGMTEFSSNAGPRFNPSAQSRQPAAAAGLQR